MYRTLKIIFVQIQHAELPPIIKSNINMYLLKLYTVADYDRAM